MRLFRILIILSIVAFFAKPCFSQEPDRIPKGPFFKMNMNLKRIGLDTIKHMGMVEAATAALSPDYIIHDGDVVTVRFWGKMEASYDVSVNQGGGVLIPSLGNIQIGGMTMDGARLEIKKVVDRKYNNVEVACYVSAAQNIRIRVAGYVRNAGVYGVSPFASITKVLSEAGGPGQWGSLSNIRLIRDGKQIFRFSVYDFLLDPSAAENPILESDDVVYVEKIKNIMALRGEVIYPGLYDSSEEIALSAFLDIGGGVVVNDGAKMKVVILRLDPETRSIETAKEVIYKPSEGIARQDDVPVKNYDTVIVTSDLNYQPHRETMFRMATVSGEVKKPGEYLINENETLGSLLKRAGGIKDTAFPKGAVYVKESAKKAQQNVSKNIAARQGRTSPEEAMCLALATLAHGGNSGKKEPLRFESKTSNQFYGPEGRMIFDLKAVIDGKSDITLENGDSISIPPLPNWVLIGGAVYNTQAVIFAEGRSVDYYLNAVGGATNGADRDNIYIIGADGCVEPKVATDTKVSRGDIIIVPEKI